MISELWLTKLDSYSGSVNAHYGFLLITTKLNSFIIDYLVKIKSPSKDTLRTPAA